MVAVVVVSGENISHSDPIPVAATLRPGMDEEKLAEGIKFIMHYLPLSNADGGASFSCHLPLDVVLRVMEFSDTETLKALGQTSKDAQIRMGGDAPASTNINSSRFKRREFPCDRRRWAVRRLEARTLRVLALQEHHDMGNHGVALSRCSTSQIARGFECAQGQRFRSTIVTSPMFMDIGHP